MNTYKHMRCGLLGEKLSHSYSSLIHSMLADYEYRHYEVARADVEDFVKNIKLDAFNVTIPYKQTVMPFLDVISQEAEAIGAVNTVVRRGGKLYGYNTDYFGFCHTLDTAKIDVKNKKVLVLGRGGAARTVLAVLRDREAKEAVTVSTENNNEEFFSQHRDSEIIINATPVGMYPKNGAAPIELSKFPMCEGVVDLIYNPAKTKLLLDAESAKIPHINGLPMLVAQAAYAYELFTADKTPEGTIERITAQIDFDTRNVVIIGMPGSGKTTLGKRVATALDRPFYDADDIFTKTYEVSPAEVITAEGEEVFRQMEHKITCELGKLCGAVISAGGGVVTREENYAPLHQNSIVIFLERDINNLSKKGRPLSQTTPIHSLYSERIASYRRFADITVQSTENPDRTCALVISTLEKRRGQI